MYFPLFYLFFNSSIVRYETKASLIVRYKSDFCTFKLVIDQFMEFIGYIASIAIGLSLGLIGGGGSILTVPVLVYFFGVSPVLATAYSLFIVGATSLVGVFPKYKEGFVSIRTTIVFGIPSIIAVFLTRKWLVPAIPENLGHIGDFEITKSLLVMLLFATLMLAASISMIRSKNVIKDLPKNKKKFNYPLIILEGSIVGMLTGLVGAGGGFLIIPALVMLGNLPMKKAIGTSLFIIALKSLLGFTGDLMQESQVIDWYLLLIVSGLAVIGIFVGNRLSNKIESKNLKKGFGWFVLFMGIYIFLAELL